LPQPKGSKVKLKPIVKTLVLAFGGFSAITSPALAQESQRLERVEITGSSIKRIDKESALPIQVIQRADIDRSGAKSTAELIQNIPAMQGFTTASESVGGGGNGFSGASIHNLGESRTLVLVNGRRIANFAGQTLTGGLAGFDLNTIPLAAIERVEVLTDGASALYGSDAIGGVVNFILKKNLAGGEVSAGFTSPQQSGAREWRVSGAYGFGDIDKQGFNALIALSKDERQPLAGIQRDFSKTGSVDFSFNGSNYRFINDSFRGVPGNATPFNSDWVRNTSFLRDGKCPTQHFASSDGVGGTYCRYDYTADLEISPKSSRDSAVGSFTFKLNNEHSLFVDLIQARSATLSRIAPPPVDIVIPIGSVFYNQYAPVLGAVEDDGDLFVGWRGTDFGKRTTDDRSTATHLVLGAKGNLGSWDYNTSYTHSTNKWNQFYKDGWISRNGLSAALDSGTINPFVGVGQQTPAAITAIANAKATGLFQSGLSKLDMVEVRASGEIAKLSSGSILLGVGLDHRKEGNSFTPGKFAQGIEDGIAGDDSQSVPFNVSRNVTGLFAEVSATLAKGFEVTAALRNDKYSDFGNAGTYKLSARFQPSTQLLIRASVGTGFRAPSVPQLAGPLRQLFGVTGNSYNCPFPESDPLAAICPPTDIQYNTYAGSNPDLKPEKSNQWTVGALWEPNKQVSIGADLWHVKIRNTIGQLDETVVFGDPNKYRNNFTSYRDPVSGRTLLALYTPNQNLGISEQTGVDITASGRFETGFGKITSNLTATYMIKYKYERLPGEGFYSNIGEYSDGGVTFRYQGKWSSNIEYGKWSHTATLNFKPGYTDQPQEVLNLDTNESETISRRVSAYSTLDLQSRYNFSKSLKFTVGILNVLATKPPLTVKSEGGQQIGFDNRYTDPRGRTFYLDANYSF
jgi:iron complex outermembrane recepter protein